MLQDLDRQNLLYSIPEACHQFLINWIQDKGVKQLLSDFQSEIHILDSIHQYVENETSSVPPQLLL